MPSSNPSFFFFSSPSLLFRFPRGVRSFLLLLVSSVGKYVIVGIKVVGKNVVGAKVSVGAKVFVGANVGITGAGVGFRVGDAVGFRVGALVGAAIGGRVTVGACVGPLLGSKEG